MGDFGWNKAIQHMYCAPAQEEKEEMDNTPSTPINAEEAEFECRNYQLRQLHRDAALAALSGMSTKTGYHTWSDLISDVNVIADEFIRQYNPDAVIAEVAG